MRFVVSGRSMEPAYYAGDRLFAVRFLKPRVGDVFVLRDPRTGRLILKRISGIENGKYVVRGDNPETSTDSEMFGAVGREQLVGKIIFRYSHT
jgi:nickel-type superoxide dismutase maturation protease